VIAPTRRVQALARALGPVAAGRRAAAPDGGLEVAVDADLEVVPARRRRRALLAGALALAFLPAPGQAASAPTEASGGSGLASLEYCDARTQLGAEQRDRLLRFAAVVKDELARSGARVALIARSGLDLRRFEQRYSHAGVTLRASAESPWAVRQLYYACDEKTPRLFDQGMSAFLMGADEASTAYVSIVFLPEPEAAALERYALDNRLALALLGPRYSANAYPFSTLYQNCNQWVAELLVASWAAPARGDVPAAREQAQQRLRAEGYAPTLFDLGARPLLWLAAFVPWLHLNDHPAEDLERNRLWVSMPPAIEAFVRARVPGAQRVELCHDGERVVLRRGWESIEEGCRAGPRDEVRPLP
jgi:hypothetical protein